VGILKGFPKSVGSMESRLYGFPCFPYSVISMACLKRGIRRTLLSHFMERSVAVEKLILGKSS
jgi:hypothetical protein